MNLKEYLNRATREGWATGHFNASELDQMRAIVEACKEVNAPAIIGTSEGEAKHLGYKEAVVLRDIFRVKYGIPIFLNADHHKSVESAKAAIDAGYDSVHIDLSAMPIRENISGTKEVVAYAGKTDSDISVEGEVGYFVTDSSSVRSEKVEVPVESLATAELAVRFIKETGVDRLAPAVGNFHGISTSSEKIIYIDLIRQIRDATSKEVALVLHGGSGLREEQFVGAIKAGMANIHVNTELRVAFVGGLKKSFSDFPDEVAMYKLDAPAIEAMKNVVKEKLKLFGSINRI